MGIKKTIMHNDFVEDDLKLPGRRVSLQSGNPSATDYIIREGYGTKTVSLAAGFDGDTLVNVNFKIPDMEPNKKYNVSGIYVPYISASDTNTKKFITTQGNYFSIEPFTITLNNIVADVNGKVSTHQQYKVVAKNTTNETVIVAIGFRYFCLLTEVE